MHSESTFQNSGALTGELEAEGKDRNHAFRGRQRNEQRSHRAGEQVKEENISAQEKPGRSRSQTQIRDRDHD